MEKAQEWDDRIPIGIFYKNEPEPVFHNRIIKGYLSTWKLPVPSSRLEMKTMRYLTTRASL